MDKGSEVSAFSNSTNSDTAYSGVDANGTPSKFTPSPIKYNNQVSENSNNTQSTDGANRIPTPYKEVGAVNANGSAAALNGS